MNFLDFFSWSYLSNLLPEGDFLIGYGILAFFILSLLTPSCLRSWGPKNKYFIKSLKKKFLFLRITSGIGLFLTLSRFADVPVFSMPLFLFFFFFIAVFFWGRALVRILKEYKKRQASVQREMEKSKN